MRVFYAITFTEDIKDYIYEKLNIVRENSISGNFTRRNNLHLTMKFIGDVDDKQLEDLKHVLDIVASKNENFTMNLSNVGVFKRGVKNIPWIGVKSYKKLQKLVGDLEDELSTLGYEKENRPYIPHITFGRNVVFDSNFDYEGVKIKSKVIDVNSIALMVSKRENGLLIYEPLYINILE